MYSENCILKKFQNNRSWFSMVTGAILSTGLPLWPELFSLEELMESYYHDEELGLSDIWFAEVMNDPKSARRSLLHDQLPSAPHGLTTEELLEQHDGACITIDPAGFRKISDDNVAACHVKYENTFNTVETLMGIMDPAELIKNTLIMALKWRVSVIGVESVGYQQTLGFWITFFMRELHIDGILVVELSPHGRSKETRIRQDVMDSYAGNSFIVDPETRRKYVWQASLYKIGEKENKDDLLDAIAYRQDMRNEYWALITPPLKDINPFPKLGVMAYNTPF
jgi:hypothetical protein